MTTPAPRGDLELELLERALAARRLRARMQPECLWTLTDAPREGVRRYTAKLRGWTLLLSIGWERGEDQRLRTQQVIHLIDEHGEVRARRCDDWTAPEATEHQARLF